MFRSPRFRWIALPIGIAAACFSSFVQADSITLVSAPPGLSEGTTVEAPFIDAIDGVSLASPVPAVVTHTESWAYPFPGASYVSSCPTCGSVLAMCSGATPPGPTSISFVHRFELPAGFADPSLVMTTTNDDAASVYLNGNFVGRAQTCCGPVPGQANFTLSTTDPSFFRAGTNEVRYELENFNAPCPISAAYVAQVDFSVPDVVVVIDIKPGEVPNSIQLGSNGVVPVAILSTTTFDATQIDPLSITLASAPVELKGKGTPMASLSDVNGDGLLDLVVQVSTEALLFTGSDTAAELMGTTFAGVKVHGSDSVRIVP